MQDFMILVFGPIAVCAALLGGAVWATEAINDRSCAIYSEETGVQTKRRFMDECYLNTPSGWMPWSEFKARAMTKEAAK